MQNFLSLGLCIYLQWYKPFASNFQNNVETFNELTTLTLTYFLLCFTDFVPAAETRNDLGYYYNAVTFANLTVHVCIMLKSSVSKIIMRLKKK